MSDNRELTEVFHQKISSLSKVIASDSRYFPILMNMLKEVLNIVYYNFLLKLYK